MLEPRAYKDSHDLEHLYSLLIAGRKADNGTYYVHIGDVQWWLYYPPIGRNLIDQLWFWYDPDNSDHLRGWALLGTESRFMDVYVQPELRNTQEAYDMFAWAERNLSKSIRQGGKTTIRIMWISENDAVMTGYLHRNCFCVTTADYYFSMPILKIADLPALKSDYLILDMAQGVEKKQRALASYKAFGSSAKWDDYYHRYLRFTESSVYDPRNDIVIVTRDGKVAAFCIIWLDPVNRVGLFEPVGVHPEHQRQGLGKAIMTEGLNRMYQSGMQQAILTTSDDNTAALNLYNSTGFRITDRLLVFEKELIE